MRELFGQAYLPFLSSTTPSLESNLATYSHHARLFPPEAVVLHDFLELMYTMAGYVSRHLYTSNRFHGSSNSN